MSGDAAKPLVSVGFPVFNEEAHLASALDSILAQDYQRLEVIVCDNASTDGTADIAREYAARDGRVTVHRADKNEGAIANFNRCFQLASGSYFTWASGHDTRLPTAIRRCVEILEEDANVILCYPRAIWNYRDGSTAPVEFESVETRHLPPALRLRETIELLSNCTAVHGVIRSAAMANTRLFRDCHGCDHVLLAELSLLGSFHQLDDVLYIRTQNRPPEQGEERHERILTLLGVNSHLARWRPYSVMLVEHMAGAWHVSRGGDRPAHAMHAAVSCWRNWGTSIKAEWHVPSSVPGGVVRSVRRVARRALRVN